MGHSRCVETRVEGVINLPLLSLPRLIHSKAGFSKILNRAADQYLAQ